MAAKKIPKAVEALLLDNMREMTWTKKGGIMHVHWFKTNENSETTQNIFMRKLQIQFLDLEDVKWKLGATGGTFAKVTDREFTSNAHLLGGFSALNSLLPPEWSPMLERFIGFCKAYKGSESLLISGFSLATEKKATPHGNIRTTDNAKNWIEW